MPDEILILCYRQLYKVLHSGDTSGLEGTIFEKAPPQPDSWDLQVMEDQKNQTNVWDVIQPQEAAAEERRKLEVDGNVKRQVEGEVGEEEEEEGEDEDDERNPKIEDVYFGNSWDEVGRANLLN